MLSERQLKLVGSSLNSSRVCWATWRGKLAFQAEPSCAILTDLNFTLSGKARIQPGGGAGYQLEIVDRRGYFQLLQRHDNDDRLLAFLLLNTFTPRVQLASALNFA